MFLIGLPSTGSSGTRASNGSMSTLKRCSRKKKRKEKADMANKTQIIAEPGRQELFIKREFDAPRELVFRAYTDPDILVQWLGPKDLKMKIEKNATAAGEPWRF